MIEIEKNVPVPDAVRLKERRKYPWHEMEVGDSFYVPKRSINAISRAAYEASRNGRKFRCRSVDDGVRVWRLA